MITGILRGRRVAATIAIGLFSFGTPAQAAETLTSIDGVIRDSLCVGSGCGIDIVFGDSTLVLRENNTRIKFADNSSGSFPQRDWEIQANSSNNGGTSYLGINDCGNTSNEGGCAGDGVLVFAVEAGAPRGALYVENTGHVGLGTTDPVVELELVSGETPTVRLRQTTAAGFNAHAWDIAGNETNFFIRDVTRGSNLPFRIFPGSPSNAIVIGPTGNVGVGTNAPSALLHVLSQGGSGKLLVDVGQGSAAAPLAPEPKFIAEFRNRGASAVQMVDTSGGQSFWAFQSQAGPAAGDATFKLTNSFGPGDEFVLQADGDLFITGTLTQGSDRNAKMAIVPVDHSEILEKVSALPVSAWTYKNDTSGARHLGPMAQDFYALFGLGESETGISTLDSSGVALAAIKALAEENATLREENAARDKRIEDLIGLSTGLVERVAELENAQE